MDELTLALRRLTKRPASTLASLEHRATSPMLSAPSSRP